MTAIDENLKSSQAQLRLLLKSSPIRYADWETTSEEIKSPLRISGGIYHFFERVKGRNISLYVGKGGLGSGNWSLCKRINQHFQPSQFKTTLLGKFANEKGWDTKMAKSYLCKAEIYLQWIVISDEGPKELVWSECFFKAVLKPKFTDN